jgi:hypothetical protein
MGQRLSGVVLLVIAIAIAMAFLSGHLQKFIGDSTAALKGGTNWNRVPFPELFRKDSKRTPPPRYN